MKLILAIDIRKEKVVKAYAGFRSNYKKLSLNNNDFSCPLFFIKTVIKSFKINTIYIADLDAIAMTKDNKELIKRIFMSFPNTNFLLDAGFNYPIAIYNYNIFLENHNLKNYSFVLGTESIKNYRIKDLLQKKNFFFSIDFNGSENKWLEKFFLEKTKLNLIFMFVKRTGGRGVNYNDLKKFKKIVCQNNSFLAGGVKNKSDFKKLYYFGFKGVLVSDIIHKELMGVNNLPPLIG